MSRHPSPGSSHPHIIPVFHQGQHSIPARQKSKAYATGIAAGAEDVKYQAKYKELKRKVKEIETDNDKLHFKVLQTKRSIQRLKLEQAVLYERLSVVPPSPDVQDRHGPTLMRGAPGIQPQQFLPDTHPTVPSHSHPRPHHSHTPQNFSQHEASHRAHMHQHPQQGDPNDFIDFMRAHHNVPSNGTNIGSGDSIHIVANPDGRPMIPVTDVGGPPSHHPSRSNSSSAAGSGPPTTPSTTVPPHDSSLQLPPFPQSYDLSRSHSSHMLPQDRARAGPLQSRPEGVYAPQGLSQQIQLQSQYPPDSRAHLSRSPSLAGRGRRHDLHEVAVEYGSGPTLSHRTTHRAPTYIGRDDHGPPPTHHAPHPHGHGGPPVMHGHGYPGDWERGPQREYTTTHSIPMRGDTPPPGAMYRVGEPIELRVASRSGTPGEGNGPNRTELGYEDNRKRKRSGDETDDVRE